VAARSSTLVLLVCALALALPTVAGAARIVALGGSDPVLRVNVTGPSSLNMGQVAEFEANASGGVAPYFWAWEVNGTPVTGNISSFGENSNFSYRPLGDAIYVVTVVVNDSSRNQTSADVELYVAGTSPVTVALTVTGPDANGTILVHATAHGGTGPYLYHWDGPGPETGWTRSANFSTFPLGSGTYTVSVEVRDSLGYVGASATTIRTQVTPASSPTIPWYDFVALGVAAGVIGMLAYAWYRRGPSRRS
jgi:SprB repeat